MNTAYDERDVLGQLLAQTAAQDQRAFAELYRRTSARLYGLALRMLRDRQEAEDVLQEVFTTIWRRAAVFDPALAGAMTWLTTLARNRAIDRLRQRRQRGPDDPIDLDRLADERLGPAADVEASQEYRRLRRCLDELDPKHSRSVREAFFSGATYKELADRCRVPLGTMKSWIRRALIQLRTCLDS
jgi:RNA polymerase sigma factor (sigma-70 family)